MDGTCFMRRNQRLNKALLREKFPLRSKFASKRYGAFDEFSTKLKH